MELIPRGEMGLMDSKQQIPRLGGYVLVAYAIRDDIEQPYGYMQKRTESDPDPYPEPVLIEGAIYDDDTGEFYVLIKRTDPTFSGADEDFDPARTWGIGYGISAPVENISKIVSAQAYSEGGGRGCFPVDFELRMSYRHFYENGENVSEEWKQAYEGFIYHGADWPGLMSIEGGSEAEEEEED